MNWQETKHGLNVKYTCKLIKACDSINANQQTKPVEISDGVKYCQLNKFPKKGTKSY